MNQKTENPFGEPNEEEICPRCHDKVKKICDPCPKCDGISRWPTVSIDNVLKQVEQQMRKERKKWK